MKNKIVKIPISKMLNRGKLFSVLITVALLIIPVSLSRADEIRDGYLHGIYFDEFGRPQLSNTSDFLDGLVDTLLVPGTWPTGLTKQSTFYWVSDADSSKLWKLSSTGGTPIAAYDTPLHGYSGLAFDGAHLWAVYEIDFELYEIAPNNGVIVNVFDLPRPDSAGIDRHPWGLAWDGQYLWHSQYGENSIIYKLDTSNGAAVDSFVSPAAMLMGITWHAPYLCGIDITNQLFYRMNPDSGNVVDNYPWAVPYPLGLHWDGTYYANVSSKEEYGGDNVIYLVDLLTGIDEEMPAPSTIELLTAYPNPFNASTCIQFTLPQPSDVRIDIYDILGRRVSTIVSEYMFAGYHSVVWRPDGLSSGMYLYRIVAGEYNATQKLTLLK